MNQPINSFSNVRYHYAFFHFYHRTRLGFIQLKEYAWKVFSTNTHENPEKCGCHLNEPEQLVFCVKM